MPDINTLPPAPAPAPAPPQARSTSASPSQPRAYYPPAADPHHQRAPSLGELHQQLEQEQEAQVVRTATRPYTRWRDGKEDETDVGGSPRPEPQNRLLQMIRQQQNQLRQMQLATGQLPSDSAVAGHDDSSVTPASDRSLIFPPLHQTAAAAGLPYPAPPRSPIAPRPHRTSFDLSSRRSSHRSRTPSRTASPALRPLSASLGGAIEVGEHAWAPAGIRDDAAFYQAETQMLGRENQMLRTRIRELERRLQDMNASASTPASARNPTPAATTGAPAPHRDGPGSSEEAGANGSEGAKA
ncbi:MAG: hypothetical protein M1826_002521 [Phylliscum demangeonii]|nr:MAG: hypothetical protein M1826_002521 [Phylliscum demangeonii]